MTGKAKHRAEDRGIFGFQWHLTDLCNGRCSHCYQRSFTRGRELSSTQQIMLADKIFDSLTNRSVSVNVTGGEPMLLDHLPQLLDHLSNKPELDELWIITNGTVAKRSTLERLEQIHGLTGIKISVEDPDPAINDSIRWPGHMESMQKNLDSFLSMGKQVLAMVTLARYNYSRVHAMVEWARKVGLAGVMFERFVPLGQGIGMTDQALDAKQWLEVCHGIAKEADQVLGQIEASLYKAFWISFEAGEDVLRGALCNLGDESMALMPDASVYPCRRLPLNIGMLMDEPFQDILRKLGEFSPERIRPRLKGMMCKHCNSRQCSGCRAMAMALSGDFLADDPLCLGPIGV